MDKNCHTQDSYTCNQVIANPPFHTQGGDHTKFTKGMQDLRLLLPGIVQKNEEAAR